MGAPMAELQPKTIEIVGSPAEVARHCDTIIIMVPDNPGCRACRQWRA